MTRHGHYASFVILLLVSRAVVAAGLPWAIWESPARLAELDATDLVLERSSHCLDGCRYDRSNPGPEGALANAYPERWLYRDGAEVVVFDERGPGALTRIWLTTGFGHATCIDPATRVRFYVDGTLVPTLDVPLAALFDGSTPPFTAPLVADRLSSSGGYVSYVPIAYAQSLRIALVNAENGGTNPCQPQGANPRERLLWFQVQHHRIAPGTPITSFVAGHDEPAWRAFLAHAGGDPWNGLLAPQSGVWTLTPGATLAIASHAGPSWLRGIRLQLPPAAYADVSLRLTFDAITTVDVPLADFFATAATASVPARGVLVGEDAGWLYAWFPMPFAQAADVELVASSNLSTPVQIHTVLSFDGSAVPATAGRFTATLADSCVVSGDPPLYAARGAGKLVGIAARYRANGTTTRGYLEGDERAYLDDAVAPSWYGTGVEDLYNGGFYFDCGQRACPYAHALSGATEVDPDGNGTTAVYRLLLTDPIAYTSGLKLTQQAGFSAAMPIPMCVRDVAFAYHNAQPTMVGYAGFEIGDVQVAAAHAYQAASGAVCTALNSVFEDAAETPRTATACRYTGGSSHFRFRQNSIALPLRLRRTFDAGSGAPGATAGSAPAEVRVNGVVAGWFPPVIANPAQRWQQQEIVLDPAAAANVMDIEIVPAFSAATPVFSESSWELRGGWKDAIFADGFDASSVPLAE
ncbi:DUF2961 domain-containing protein [Dokdonella soli]|uniref:DUF2961 domain-containing protein n=1 Tax=Dokdonella soli TaxID=529810 RepID=A0ABN1IPH1_9GAMM